MLSESHQCPSQLNSSSNEVWKAIETELCFKSIRLGLISALSGAWAMLHTLHFTAFNSTFKRKTTLAADVLSQKLFRSQKNRTSGDALSAHIWHVYCMLLTDMFWVIISCMFAYFFFMPCLFPGIKAPSPWKDHYVVAVYLISNVLCIAYQNSEGGDEYLFFEQSSTFKMLKATAATAFTVQYIVEHGIAFNIKASCNCITYCNII